MKFLFVFLMIISSNVFAQRFNYTLYNKVCSQSDLNKDFEYFCDSIDEIKYRKEKCLKTKAYEVCKNNEETSLQILVDAMRMTGYNIPY